MDVVPFCSVIAASTVLLIPGNASLILRSSAVSAVSGIFSRAADKSRTPEAIRVIFTASCSKVRSSSAIG